jgi:heme exporter protein C
MKDRALGIATLAALIVALYFAFLYAPTEASMGTVQRIFYFHVAAGILSYVAFIVVGVASVAFLANRELKWDRLAYCSAEIGVLFATTNIAMGILWAKPVWGIWWTFDARLTLQLLLALIFVAYLMLGVYIADPMKRASLQAVFGILGSVDVPINYLAIRLWRTQHPEPVIAGGPDSGLDSSMALALLVAVVALGLLYTYMLRRRLDLESSSQRVEYLEQMVLTR